MEQLNLKPLGNKKKITLSFLA